jgi:hypothetical protein
MELLAERFMVRAAGSRKSSTPANRQKNQQNKRTQEFSPYTPVARRMTRKQFALS